MGMPFVVCLSLTFHGGETQGESVLRKFKKRSCIKILKSILKHLVEP